MTTVDAATAYWDALEAGDPTPPFEERSGGLCWIPAPRHMSRPYACGRPEGHAGQHVAPTTDRIVATWLGAGP